MAGEGEKDGSQKPATKYLTPTLQNSNLWMGVISIQALEGI